MWVLGTFSYSRDCVLNVIASFACLRAHISFKFVVFKYFMYLRVCMFRFLFFVLITLHYKYQAQKIISIRKKVIPIQKATFWNQFKTGSEVNRNKVMLQLFEREPIFHSLRVLYYLCTITAQCCFHPLKTSENPYVSWCFQGYRKATQGCNVLMLHIHICALRVRKNVKSLCYCVDKKSQCLLETSFHILVWCLAKPK